MASLHASFGDLPSYTLDLEGEISEWAESLLPERRVAHVRGVVATAARLADRYAPEHVARVRLAGWIHDIAKDWDDARLLAYAEAQGFAITPTERATPMLLHGAVSYALAVERFGLDDPLLEEACALHTTGAPGMSDVAKILFVADLAEPSRSHKRADRVREVMEDKLDSALLAAVDSVLRYLIRKQRRIDPRAFDLRDELLAAGTHYKR